MMNKIKVIVLEIDKDFNLIVGLRIREVRENMHLTREQFSEQCDISDSFLTAVESGRRGVTAKTLYKICQVTGVSADYFITGNKQGFEIDAVCALVNAVDEDARGNLLNIMREYADAINRMKK